VSIDSTTHQEVFSCRSCSSPVFDDEQFCEVCGAAAPTEPVAPHPADSPAAADRDEWDLVAVAALSDRGHRRSRNEDTARVARAGERMAVVVCDGVASTANPHLAAVAAADAALAVLSELLARPEWPGQDGMRDAVGRAFAAADRAVLGVPDDEPDGNDLSPSTTMVVALAAPGQAVVGNVGDSRAYWLSGVAGRSRLLTVDDSWAQASIAEGMAPEAAYAHPDAHTITRWIGADAEPGTPSLTTLDVTEPGVLLVCTDGLWNYFAHPEELAALVRLAGPAPMDMVRRLSDAALAAGGQDNVTVAALPVAPASSSPSTGPDEE